LLIGVYLIRNQLQKVISSFVVCWVVFAAQAQTKYWIGFKDKSIPLNWEKPLVSPKTIENRKLTGFPLIQRTDYPVNIVNVDSLKKRGVTAVLASKWLNAVSAYLTDGQVAEIKTLGFVAYVEQIQGHFYPTQIQSDELITAALADMNGEEFIAQGKDGTGVDIGVIDAGFYDADREAETSHLFLSEKILDTRDYLDSLKPISYSNKVTDLDDHGTEVLRCLGGYDIGAGLKYGLATGAQYYLARTDHGKFENRAEEDKWIVALEWLDSLGVRLVNSSLGYATGFDLVEENYKPHQMDGKTSKISKAAQIATQEKGMTLVVSAGNEGDKANWLVLTAPADAEGVIAVGAVKSNVWEKVSHSSIGPEWLSYIKPDVAAFSLKGTSFSAPLVTGFLACLLQMDSTLSGKELKEILLKSGHLYPFGNNYIGFGVPQAKKAIQLVRQKQLETSNVIQRKVSGKKISVDLNTSEAVEGILFRKKSTFSVIKQEIFKTKNGKLEYKRLENEKFTTIQVGDVVMEFEWIK